ncbi:MAG TPA: hypothetical protein VJW77_13350, partial [Terriglobia bacterium]|nr:hypothetical protein [Terriglobia bacterium]
AQHVLHTGWQQIRLLGIVAKKFHSLASSSRIIRVRQSQLSHRLQGRGIKFFGVRLLARLKPRPPKGTPQAARQAVIPNAVRNLLCVYSRRMKQILRCAQNDVLVALVEKFAYIANGATYALPANKILGNLQAAVSSAGPNIDFRHTIL